MWLMAWADRIEEVKTVCWCGRSAKLHRPDFGEDGKIVRTSPQVVLGKQ